MLRGKTDNGGKVHTIHDDDPHPSGQCLKCRATRITKKHSYYGQVHAPEKRTPVGLRRARRAQKAKVVTSLGEDRDLPLVVSWIF